LNLFAIKHQDFIRLARVRWNPSSDQSRPLSTW